MALLTSIMTGGVNNHPTTSDEANAWSTDFISEGIVGSFTGGPPSTGAYAVTAQGSPDMTVAVATGVCYVQGTPTSQSSQTFRVKHTASENVTISANSSGSTKYDWVYIKLDATKLNGPNVAGDDAATLVTSRSTSQSSDDGTPPTYGYPIAVVTVANGASSITSGNIRDLRANCIVNLGSTSVTSGWTEMGYAPNTVTALGNRSYSLVFNSTDLTSTTSVGQRLKLPRTVTAPTQCADLERGSSQYFNDTSLTGMTFTDDFVVSAWIKLESYNSAAAQTIVSRYNGTSGWLLRVEASGTIALYGFNAGASNWRSVASYQSVPVGKWVHVAAELDMSAHAVGATDSYVMIDGVNVPAVVAQSGTTPSALIQAGELQIGAANGGEFFDGKLAQVAIYSAKVTQATIKASMNQTLTGSETSLVSAYTFNNSINDLSANANNLTAQGSALATNTDTPFTNPVTGTSVTAGTTNYGIIMAQTFSTNTTYTIQVPEGETLPTTGGIGTVSYSAQSNPYGWPSSANKRIGTVLLQGSSPTATALTQILGMTQTFTADANKEYKITVQPGASMALSGSGATSAMSIWDGTVGSGTQLMESHVTSAGTNYGAATSVWWTGKLSAGSHTINLGLRAIGAGTTTLGVAVVTPAIFTIEEVV